MTNKGTKKTFRYVDIMAGYYFITQSNDIASRVWHYIEENYIPWEKGAEAMARHILDDELDFATREQDGEQYAWIPDYNAYTKITDGGRLISYAEALAELTEACQVYLNSNEEDEDDE